MKKFVKNYIGKGRKVEGLEIIKINLKISDILKFAHKYNDEDYISLEVAKLQTPDNFGHDYTAHVNRLEEEQVSLFSLIPGQRRKLGKKEIHKTGEHLHPGPHHFNCNLHSIAVGNKIAKKILDYLFFREQVQILVYLL